MPIKRFSVLIFCFGMTASSHLMQKNSSLEEFVGDG